MLTVEELAEKTGETVRTIRFYQSEGVLPRPVRHGRHARYDEEHVARLRTISELQRRGLRLSAIRDLLRYAPDTSPAEWHGLGETLDRPWTDDRPALFSEADLRQRVEGAGLAQDPDTVIDGLVEAKVVERRGDTTPVVYLVPSPGLLDVALESARLGLDPVVAAHLRDLLQRKLRALADILVAEFTHSVSLDRLADAGPAELARLLEQLRPLTLRTVDLLFAHEMERAQRELTAVPPTPRRKKRA